MMNMLLFFAPQEAWVALIVLGGILIMVGLRKIGFSIIAIIILLAIFSPFIDALMDSLQTGLLLILMAVCLFGLFRAVFGRRVAENVLSGIILALLLAPFRFLGWLFGGNRRRP